MHDISSGFSSAGIALVVVDNDYTLRFWEPRHHRQAAFNFHIINIYVRITAISMQLLSCLKDVC